MMFTANLNIVESDSLKFLCSEPNEKYDLIYVDPPYNTGKRQETGKNGYLDSYKNYKEFIYPMLKESHRVLKSCGGFFCHLDWREVHQVKVWLDEIYGEDNFRNEIIWHSEIGNSPKNTWPRKHTNILWYSKTSNYIFNNSSIPMVPRKAQKPGYDNTKRMTDVWEYNLSTSDPERVKYPNQKPLAILEPIVAVHSNPGSECLDFFGGSGSFGAACLRNNRNVTLVDQNPQAIEIMKSRFGI